MKTKIIIIGGKGTAVVIAEQIIDAIENAKKSKKPNMIIANTIKGKGVSFMENQVGWHGKAPNEEQYNQAVKELS